MRYDTTAMPPQLAALFEQIAATEARIAELDRELAAIRAGRLLDLPHRSAPDVEDTTADVLPAVDEEAALVARPAERAAVRPLRQSGRPAKKQGRRRH